MISANVITVNEINSSIAIEIQEEINKEKNNSFNIKLRKYYRNQVFSRKRTWYKNKNRNGSEI